MTTTASVGSDPGRLINVRTACAVFPQISWANEDTDPTIEEIKIHNAKWKRVCTKD